MRLTICAAVLALLCLVVAIVPYFGPPNFRYTGSDPSRHVWNFGFPIANAIHDPRSGWHEGPVAIVLLPLQFLAMLIFGAIAVGLDLKKRRRARTP